MLCVVCAKKALNGEIMCEKCLSEEQLKEASESGKLGHEKIRCPHCDCWNSRWSKKFPGKVICDKCNEPCIINGYTIKQQISLLSEKNSSLFSTCSDLRYELDKLKNEIEELKITPWVRFKEKIRKYKSKPKQIKNDILNSKYYKRTVFRFHKKCYRIGSVRINYAQYLGTVVDDEPRVQIECTPNYIGRLMKYQSFKEGYWKKKPDGWQRMPNFIGRPLSDGFKDYLDELVKKHKE